MKHKLFIFPLLALLLLQHTAQAQQPDSVRLFLDSALNVMQRHSMFTDKVDWKKVRDSAAALSKRATTYTEATPAIQYAFNQLGDKHGWLVLDNQDYRNPSFTPDTGRVSANMKEAAAKGPRVYSGIVSKDYAYISIPFFGKQDTASMNRFAQQIQDSLCNVLSPKTKGVILDLRLNAGGNLFPMVLGLSNVYGSQHNKGATKSFVGDWDIQNNRMQLNETVTIGLKANCGDYTQLPVAVIVGPVTGSSGEFLAIAFSTRKKTILIGEPTAGYTTGNMGFRLPGTNNGIVLSESVAIDKNGTVYPNGVQPAINIVGDDFFNRGNDKKVQAAVKWLKQQQ